MVSGGDSDDLYLVLHPFAELAESFKSAVARLADREEQPLLGVDGYYCEEIDSAILNLRFVPTFVAKLGVGRVIERVSSWGAAVIAPEQLTPAERDHFFLEHLSRYSIYVQHYPSDVDLTPMLIRAVDAIGEYARTHRHLERAITAPRWSPPRRHPSEML